MRIAIVTTSYPRAEGDPGGHFVATEVGQLRAAGHHVTVVSPKVGRGSAFGSPGVLANLRARPWQVTSAVAFVRHARAWLSANRVDRVDAHWALPSAWPIALQLHESTALRVTSHGSDVRILARLPAPVRANVVRAIAERATLWKFVSSALLDDFIQALDAVSADAVTRIAVVEALPIEVPDVAVRAQAIRDAQGPFGVVVGRLVASKRVDLAMEHARVSAPTERLFVIGEGPERERLSARAQANRVNVRFLGALPRPETLAWIAAARCLYFASIAEGCPTVLREAEILGTPVVRIAASAVSPP